MALQIIAIEQNSHTQIKYYNCGCNASTKNGVLEMSKCNKHKERN